MTQSYFKKYKGLHIFSVIVLLLWLAITLYMMVSINNGGFANPDLFLLVHRIAFFAHALTVVLLLIQLLLLIFYDYVKTSTIFFGLCILIFLLSSIKGLADDFLIFIANPDLLYNQAKTQLDQILYLVSMGMGYVVLVAEIIGMVFAKDKAIEEEGTEEGSEETEQSIDEKEKGLDEAEEGMDEKEELEKTVVDRTDDLSQMTLSEAPSHLTTEQGQQGAVAGQEWTETGEVAEKNFTGEQAEEEPGGSATKQELEALYGKDVREKKEIDAQGEETKSADDSEAMARRIHELLGGGRDVTPKD